MKIYDTLVIGGGQAGLSVAYFLRRTNLEYLILEDKEEAGGSWLNTWDSLTLFSPTAYNSLSGWQMPGNRKGYPSKDEFIAYLSAYEKRYHFPIQRSTRVKRVEKENTLFKLTTSSGILYSKTLVGAMGTANHPYVPRFPGNSHFKGLQLHSVDYKNPDSIKGKKVLIVGGGNSGAQILAEVSKVAETKWVTLQPPRFLPPDIDGHHLFNQANELYFNQEIQGKSEGVSLNDIVQVPPVKEGLKRGIYQDLRPFKSFYEEGVVWSDGEKEAFDAVIWCTGFDAVLDPLEPLGVVESNRVATLMTRSVKEPALWLVGYGNWTGFASATIYGVGKTAKDTVKEIQLYFKPEESSS